jgi:hypothetical protein
MPNNTIGSAGSSLNIRLGQVPDVRDPQARTELQLVYNALHLLSSYLDVLRENLESAPGQTPSESVRFRRTFWGVALQDITVGSVCCSFQEGIINGVATTPGLNAVTDPAVTVGSTGSRRRFQTSQQSFYIALTAATAGQLVQVGVGPGIIQVAGAKCGQLVWGVAALSNLTYREANTVTQFSAPATQVGNGGLYLANITGGVSLGGGVAYGWEGYWLPGYPNSSGGTFYYNRAFLYPIGVCVSDGYVIFSDFKRSDPLPDQNF